MGGERRALERPAGRLMCTVATSLSSEAAAAAGASPAPAPAPPAASAPPSSKMESLKPSAPVAPCLAPPFQTQLSLSPHHPSSDAAFALASLPTSPTEAPPPPSPRARSAPRAGAHNGRAHV